MKKLQVLVCAAVMLACAGFLSAAPTQNKLARSKQESKKLKSPSLKDYKAKNEKPAEVQPESFKDVCRAKMEAVKIAEISFLPPSTLSDALEYLRKASIDLGNGAIPINKRGINFVIITNASSGPEEDDSFIDDLVMPRMGAKDVSLYEALTLICQMACLTFEIVDENTVVVFSPVLDFEKIHLDSTKNSALSKNVVEAMKKVCPVELHIKTPATIVEAVDALKYNGTDYIFNLKLDADKLDKDNHVTSRVWISASNISLYDALRFVCLSSSARFEFFNKKTVIITNLPEL